jgi:polyisoprenoid-binding protein YceI
MKTFILLFAVLFTFSTTNAQTYTVGDAGSSVHFVIKNFGVKTGGDFTGLSGTVIFNPKSLATSSMKVSVKSNTVDTDNNARDKHLKKAEYFDVDKYTTIDFVSTKISESTIAGRFFVQGNLTIKGVTKVVSFGFTATPNATGYNFAGEFDINRRDFGVGGNSMSLADKLKVTLNVAAKK